MIHRIVGVGANDSSTTIVDGVTNCDCYCYENYSSVDYDDDPVKIDRDPVEREREYWLMIESIICTIF